MVESDVNVVKNNYLICSHPFDMTLLCEEWWHSHWKNLTASYQSTRKKNEKDARLFVVLSLFSFSNAVANSQNWKYAEFPQHLMFLDTSCQRHRSWDRLADHSKGNRRALKHLRPRPHAYCQENWGKSAQDCSSLLCYRLRSKNLFQWLLRHVGGTHFQGMRTFRFRIC